MINLLSQNKPIIMKTILITLLLIPFIGISQITLDWEEFTGGVSLSTDETDNIYTVSWDYNPAGDIYLTKHDAAGNFLWTVSYDNTDNTRHEVATWVETDHENNILVSGTIRSGYASPVNAASVLMKFDPSGTLLWRVVYETTFDGSYTKKILIDADNNIYVLGLGFGDVGQVTKVKKFDSNGIALWSYFNEAGIGAPMNFKFTPDNNILIIGRGIIGSINGYAKIDLAGNEIWSYAGVNSLTIGDAAGDSDGNTYIINGEYIVVGIQGSIITKLSPSGSVIWTSTNDITATKVEVGSDNNPIVAGFPSVGGAGVAMIKYNNTGTPIWINMDADGPGAALLLHNIMKLDAANNAYFAAGTLFQQAVCKVNSDGSNAWLALASGGYNVDFDFGNDYSIYMLSGLSIAHFIQEPIITCDPPAGLFTNNISTTKARLNWTIEPGAVQYEVWYKKTTAAVWKKKFVPGINNKLNLKNLQCNKNYEWQIRTICDTVGTDLVSAFSPVQNFTTAVCREEISENANAEMLLYPNPAINSITIILPESGMFHYNIVSATGQPVFDQEFNIDLKGESITIDVKNLPAGIYFIDVHNDQIRYTDQLLIQK